MGSGLMRGLSKLGVGRGERAHVAAGKATRPQRARRAAQPADEAERASAANRRGSLGSTFPSPPPDGLNRPRPGSVGRARPASDAVPPCQPSAAARGGPRRGQLPMLIGDGGDAPPGASYGALGASVRRGACAQRARLRVRQERRVRRERLLAERQRCRQYRRAGRRLA